MLDDILKIPQYSLSANKKKEILLPLIRSVHEHHLSASEEYKRIVGAVFPNGKIENLSNLPFVQVGLFKEHLLRSVPKKKVFKTLSSSGTTGSELSRIVLDKETARMQTKSLSSIMTSVLGRKRLPMLLCDTAAVYAGKQNYGARGAGVLGLSVFGRKHTYMLNENMELENERLKTFLEEYSSKPMIIFGFTFMVWKYFFGQEIFKNYDLSKAILIHSGGWKKMQEMSVGNTEFREHFLQEFGINRIYNFYGMVEQVGSIYLENEKGFLHCPNFSDIIIRKPDDLSVQEDGEPGLIQVISPLPMSYPGHSILTEDIGVQMGEDDPELPWKGKFFKIIGRAKKAELRGCSDTFASSQN